ncbi:putative chromatin regulator PHD family [Helianthus annuus]|nr:putative chromatin regulator PHD family [Helianthus annuus]KAJ0638676.1 putative chromatin regulator PHD family [Helianthus annuus]KAJ0897776.1 putative chromatin regulator PHD family [Helianthus annuus]
MAMLEACINNTTTTRKRKQRIFEFKTFPKSIGDRSAPFRDNIRSFLDEFCEQIEPQLNIWSTLLLCESNGVVFPLYTIEEHINDHSLRPFCCHCKFVGWGHHFVCKRRYRFMIPPYGDKQPMRDYDRNNNLELDDSYVLHGLIHCNGFGHLISVNKLDLGSANSLTQADVMSFWDGICTSLKTRNVSVADVKLDRSMELRLIHGVAFKSSWFGNWGYKFGNGSFGVTEDKYRGAVQFLAELSLDKIIDDFKSSRHRNKLQRMICKYQEFSGSRLSSLSELMQCVLEFKETREIERAILSPRKVCKYEHYASDEESRNSMCLEQFLTSLLDADGRWPPKRVEYSLEVIVKLLKQKNDPMSRDELRESARPFVGDTGLIDFVLKSINVLSFENYVIRRVVNSLTRLVEFEICEAAYDLVDMKPVSSLWKLEPRWPKQRLERTAKVIANILKDHKVLNPGRNGAMSRKDLRNMASKYVGDTGLIDFVLKSIDNLVVGNHIISRTKNPLTRLMEFEIRDRNSEEFGSEEERDVYGDILFLYKKVLLGYPLWNSVSQACRLVLNSKYFVKEWELGVGNAEFMTLTCRVLPSFHELDTELTRPLPPGELVMVTPWMTIANLREVAQRALRDTYCMMNKFVVGQIGGLKGIQDEMVLAYAVEAGAEVWVRGCGLDLSTGLRYEGGDGYEWESRVECVCGAREDDGERMVACDECHVWKHTMCSGIDDDELELGEFVCGDCDAKSKSELLSQ